MRQKIFVFATHIPTEAAIQIAEITYILTNEYQWTNYSHVRQLYSHVWNLQTVINGLEVNKVIFM